MPAIQAAFGAVDAGRPAEDEGCRRRRQSLAGLLNHALSMSTYLVARGAAYEAAGAARRALELLGMLGWLHRDPALNPLIDQPDSAEFRDAFHRGPGKRARQELHERGIQYRFAALHGPWPRLATGAYAWLSRFFVHGAGPNAAPASAQHACQLNQRSIEASLQLVPVFRMLWLLVVRELLFECASRGTRVPELVEPVATYLAWADPQSGAWRRRQEQMRLSLGLGDGRARTQRA